MISSEFKHTMFVLNFQIILDLDLRPYLPQIPKSGVAFSMLHRPVNKKGKNPFEFNIKTFRVMRWPEAMFSKLANFLYIHQVDVELHTDEFAPLTETTPTKCISSLVSFQNEDIFVQLDELDKLDRITYA